MDTTNIDEQKMNRVLAKFRSRLTWAQLKHGYETYTPSYNPGLFRAITIGELQFFATIFCFTKNTLPACGQELSNFVRHIPDFYGDTLEEVYRKMCAALDVFNRGQPETNRRPYVNWIPMYGGLIQTQNARLRQVQYMNGNGIEPILDRQYNSQNQ